MVIVFLPGVNAGIWQGIFPKVRGKKASFFLKKGVTEVLKAEVFKTEVLKTQVVKTEVLKTEVLKREVTVFIQNYGFGTHPLHRDNYVLFLRIKK